MAGALPRKKPNNKRPNLKPPASMAYASSSPSIYKKISLFAIVLLAICVVALWSISSIMSTVLKFDAYSDQLYSVEVVNEFPHDPSAFTQGLLYAGNDTLFESTGIYGQSSVRKVALQTGKVLVLHMMDNSYFGEGLTLLGEWLFQVTWLKNIGFMYDRNNLSQFQKFTHQMQDGWGLATDGKVLFGSDGTSTLYQIDPQTLKVIKKQTVKYKDHEIHNLNELEYVNGEIWENVWQGRIASSGKRDIDVLNGIAWDRDRKHIFVTGKLWPKLYEIKLQPAGKPCHGFIEQICIRMPVHFMKP